MTKVKGAVANKVIIKKQYVECCRLNPAMRKIMEQRIKKEREKQPYSLDVADVQRQVEDMLNREN